MYQFQGIDEHGAGVPVENFAILALIAADWAAEDLEQATVDMATEDRAIAATGTLDPGYEGVPDQDGGGAHDGAHGGTPDDAIVVNAPVVVHGVLGVMAPMVVVIMEPEVLPIVAPTKM